VASSKEYMREWRARNRARLAEYNAAWRAQNPDKVQKYGSRKKRPTPTETRAYMAVWREKNAEKIRAYMAVWREENREKTREYMKENRPKYRGIRRVHQAKRMGTLINNGPVYTAKDWQRYLDLFGDRCLACGQRPERLTADHVVPVVLGGANTIDNIQGLCQSCNSAKGARIVDYRVA
jgi:5-methylcytosine-specific restriction endonuclease McrA